MAFHYIIDPEIKLIRMTCTGQFTIAGLKEHSLQVNDDPIFEPGMNTLCDYREAEWMGEPSEIADYVDHAEILAKVRGACKWACLVSSDDDESIIRTFDLVLRDRGIPIETRPFRTEEKAMRWLQEKADDSPAERS